MSGEYGEMNAYYARGNTIWAVVGMHNVTTSLPVSYGRMLRSTDAGLTWTATSLPPGGVATGVAFRDASNGLCFNNQIAGGAVLGYQVSRTSNGGTTWTRIVPSLADTASTSPHPGKFYYTGLDASQGYFISYGRWRVYGQGANRLPQFGYSVSLDGITWRDVQTSLPMTSLDVLDSDGHGYAGFITDDTSGSGGIFKTMAGLPGGALRNNPLLPASNRNLALQQALSVYPNPGNGSFTLKLSSSVKAGARVTVVDALGRLVYNRELNAAATNAETASIDLRRASPGVYTLEVRTPEGTAQQKLIIQP
jgi:hypothetical protein